MVQSVCPSVTPFWLCSHHRIITRCSGVITNDRSDGHAKGQGHRSKVRVTEVITQLSSFRTVTPVWIHLWWWNDAQSLMLLWRGALLIFKVICQISRSHGSKNRLGRSQLSNPSNLPCYKWSYVQVLPVIVAKVLHDVSDVSPLCRNQQIIRVRPIVQISAHLHVCILIIWQETHIWRQ